METKKRPNDDTLEPEAVSSTHTVTAPAVSNNNGSSSMELDHSITDNQSSLISNNASSAIENAPVPGEANKRLKLTTEASETSETLETPARYSPAMDIVDPSNEAIGQTAWVENMDKDNEKGLLIYLSNQFQLRLDPFFRPQRFLPLTLFD